MGPIEELREEHGAIMKVFAILQGISEKMEDHDPRILDPFRRVLEFMRIFVDQCHHAKEEEFLFPALVEAQSKNIGLIEELVSEHEEGRRMADSLEAVLGRMDQGDREGAAESVATIRNYLKLFRTHLRMENGILFPEARELLPGTVQERIVLEFQKLEEERIGKGRHEAFHRMIEELGESGISEQ